MSANMRNNDIAYFLPFRGETPRAPNDVLGTVDPSTSLGALERVAWPNHGTSYHMFSVSTYRTHLGKLDASTLRHWQSAGLPSPQSGQCSLWQPKKWACPLSRLQQGQISVSTGIRSWIPRSLINGLTNVPIMVSFQGIAPRAPNDVLGWSTHQG
jgi:hypothetical protein